MRSLYIKLLTVILLLSSVAIVAQVPLSDNHTVWQHLFGKQKQEISEAGFRADPVLTEAMKELRQIGEAFSADSLSMSGYVKLYDNLDDKGIKESQNFTWQKAGINQHFKIDSIEKILLGNRYLFIDHKEKEIISSDNSIDSVVKAMQLLSLEKVVDLIGKDGTTARFDKNKELKVLYIEPGSHDDVNEYAFYYDPFTYALKKFTVSYTSTPFEDEILTDNTEAPVTEAKPAGTEEKEDDGAIELNLTEYIVEYNFQRLEKNCRFSFSDNELFKKGNNELLFKGKIATYHLIEL
jgi:hypothetical protein